MGREDRYDVTDRGKESEVEYHKFPTPYFIPKYRNCNNAGSSWQAEAISRATLIQPGHVHLCCMRLHVAQLEHFDYCE